LGLTDGRQRVLPLAALLGIDLGLRMGWALFATNGRLLDYGAHNFGSKPRLKRGCRWFFDRAPNLDWLLLEGGGFASGPWLAEARRRQIQTLQIDAQTWRQVLFPPRDQAPYFRAKQRADRLARSIIDWSGAKRPTTLRHDSAEAICLGLWGVLELGWLPKYPKGLC
jgi:hypothetical protein